MAPNLGRAHQLLVEHHCHLACGVGHDAQRRGGALAAAELFLQRCLVREAELLRALAEEAGQLLHVELAVRGHHEQEEASLLVLDEQILGEAAAERLDRVELEALLHLFDGVVLDALPRDRQAFEGRFDVFNTHHSLVFGRRHVPRY